MKNPWYNIERRMRTSFFIFCVFSLLIVGAVSLLWPSILYALILLGPIIVLGLYDALQKQHAVLRNFPVIGHGRYLMEMIRPEVSQYFIELDNDGRPFSREERSLVYQRAKAVIDTLPFGTRQNVNAEGYEWLNYSLAPRPVMSTAPRIVIGGPACTSPYSASLLNISAMSYGAISKNAVLALNGGAKIGGFAQNTGEGGVSPYHLEPGGDLIWQIGTAYFGCRTWAGNFDPGRFEATAQRPSVKMIEIKLSQGAKPGHGGILPGNKVSEEIARIRGVEVGRTIISPPCHTAFSTPIGLLEFVARLRELAGGKPVGFKLCLGRRKEFFGICKAMLETGITPDFIVVDGAEGGTGAAPLEFSNSVGAPLDHGLAFVHNALVGIGVRERVRVFASGRIISAFNMATKFALGADVCYSARGFMFALGCIQALRCNSNKCPVGITTHDPNLIVGLVVHEKVQRVANYHRATVRSLLELLSAAGLEYPSELDRRCISRQLNRAEVRTYADIFPSITSNSLRYGELPAEYADDWRAADAARF